MLYDDAAVIAPAADGVKVTARMKYRYATSVVRIDAESVRLTASGPGESEVHTVDGLTTLANEHVGELAKAYPPLGRVVRYAALAAFLRWAIQARDAGQLGAIDLSGLAGYPAQDRTQFPTADVIKK
jgi:hypothetical protein